jgi:hypothetical protein
MAIPMAESEIFLGPHPTSIPFFEAWQNRARAACSYTQSSPLGWTPEKSKLFSVRGDRKLSI